MAKSSFTAKFSVIDRVSAPLKKLDRQFSKINRGFKSIGQASSGMTSMFSGMLAPLGALFGAAGIGGIAGLGAKIIGTSAQFEKFQTILETVEGSSAKAKASMDWVSQFATDTPYELAEVTDAFVKLKAYGIDPQAGALASAGDAAAAMGKPLESAVEALADAMTGENERLKEFGITTQTLGNQIKYNWTQNGEQMTAIAQKNSREQSQAIIQGIWNANYGGAGAKLATTWDGLWSNMLDGVTRFFKMIGDAGVFEFMKGQLSGLLAIMNKMAADGSLQALAKTISDELVEAFKELKSWFEGIDWKGVWADVKGFAAAAKDLFIQLGGLKGIAVVLGVLFGAQFLASVVGIASGFMTLGVALGPVGWALIAIAGAVALVYANWDNIVAYFSEKFDRIKAAFKDGFLGGMITVFKELNPLGLMMDAINGLVKYLFDIDLGKKLGDQFRRAGDMLPDWAKRQLGIDAQPVVGQGLPGLGGTDTSPLQGLPKGGLLPNTKQALMGKITLDINGALPGMKVTSGKTNQPGVAMEANVGYRSLAMP